MYRLIPVLVLLAVVPESEKKLENLSAYLTSAKESVTTIKNSLETFEANAVPHMAAMAGYNFSTKGQSRP